MKKEFTRKKKYIIAALFLVSTLGIYALYFQQKAARPNIFLITIDALRADHLGCYGYARNTSPNIDKLAKEGVVFSQCFAESCGTSYSFPTILTGKYLAVDEKYVFLNNILDQKFTTVAEYLRSAGYYTAAFLNNGNLKEGKGFEQGFDFYFLAKDAQDINKRVLDFMGSRRNGKPLFIWIHYLDPHAPYSSIPEGCLENFMHDQLYGKSDKVLELNPTLDSNLFTSMGYIPRITFQEGHYNLNYYIACYDCEIRHTDFYVGELLKNMKDGNFIILSADHGESLGEHDHYFTHEESIYDAALHIPLIIKDSRSFKGGKRVSTVASSVDILPTILSRIRPVWYFFNGHRFDGIALQGPLNKREPKRRYVYSFCPWAWSIRDVKNNVKYILQNEEIEELYFLPDESTNHIDDRLQESIRIKEEVTRALKNWRKDYPAKADLNTTKAPLDQQTRDQLKNLGYLQ
jgi:arylsulfatase